MFKNSINDENFKLKVASVILLVITVIYFFGYVCGQAFYYNSH